MEWALLGISLVGFGFAATAIALAIRNGSLTAEKGKLSAELKGTTAEFASLVESSRARIGELEAVAESRNDRIAALYGELATCGDPESRARIAVDGIRLMLPFQEDDDPGAT